MIFDRAFFVDAFLESYKKFGISIDEDRIVKLSNFMLPIFGSLFLVGGIVATLKLLNFI